MKDTTFKQGFAERLYNIIEERGITRRQLSEAIGVSYPALASYLGGREEGKGALPPLEIATRLADTLDISLDELCGRNTEVVPAPQQISPMLAPPALKTDAQQRLKDIYEAGTALNFSIGFLPGDAVTLTSDNRFVRMFFEQMQGGVALNDTLDVFNDLQVCDGELVDPITYRVMKAKEGGE